MAEGCIAAVAGQWSRRQRSALPHVCEIFGERDASNSLASCRMRIFLRAPMIMLRWAKHFQKKMWMYRRL